MKVDVDRDPTRAWTLAQRCELAENSLPRTEYRTRLERLHSDMLVEIARLSEHLAGFGLEAYEALQRDAERYRWLRLQDWETGPLAVVANPKDAIKLGHDAPSRERLDAMIGAHVAEVQGFISSVVDALVRK